MTRNLTRWTSRWHCTECGRWIKPGTLVFGTAPEDPRRPVVTGDCSLDGHVRVKRESWWTRR